MRARRALVVAVVFAVLAWLAALWWGRSGVREAELQAPSDTAGAGFRAMTLWFVSPSGDSLVPEPRELIEQAERRERVAVLVSELARGPIAGGLPALPPGTALLHVYLDEGGVMTLDLSPAFRDGFRGGTSAELLALAALGRTLQGAVPEMRRLLVVCDGAPLATLGGHLPLDQPLDVSELP